MVARWWGCGRIPPQVSTGTRTRATIKALPSPLHDPRPYGCDELFVRLMSITPQLMHLALSDPSIRRKRHESVMTSL